MDPSITFEEFHARLSTETERFAREAWAELVESQKPVRVDKWMRERGGALLRQALGLLLEAKSEQLGVAGPCSCGEGEFTFRQRRKVRLHTILPGRDVDTVARYGQCSHCRKGRFPLLEQVGNDTEGYTPELRELSVLAATLEPYESATTQLLGRFAGVDVSRDKLQSLVADYGERAGRFLGRAGERDDEKIVSDQVYAEIDGGMIHVDGAWQECKVATLFRSDERVEVSANRNALLKREVLGVRGPPSALAHRLRPRLDALGTVLKPVACIGDGAAWIWNLFAEVFPERIEILDWYHVDEHVSQAARALHGEGTEEAAFWRAKQLDRLEHDEVEAVLEALRFARRGTRSRVKVEAIDALHRYLETHRERVRYGTFRKMGLLIGSGAIEGAINHVVQQRMKRPGMRWKAAGADHVLALRCVYRSTGHWDDFLSWRPAA
jgi:hypothetical protein